jgi:hypothetical protein
MKWLVLYFRNARVGSAELTAENLAACQRGFYMNLIQRDQDGCEHWALVAPRRKSS